MMEKARRRRFFLRAFSHAPGAGLGTTPNELPHPGGGKKGQAGSISRPSIAEDPSISTRDIALAALMVAIAPSFWAPNDLAAQGSDEEVGVLVEGEVVDHETGDPVRGAAVSLAAGPSGTEGRGTRVTDDDGRFLFSGVPPGTYRLTVTSQSYRKMSDTLQVSADDVEVRLPLSIQPIELEPIIVTARRSSRVYRGYDARRRAGAGFVVTREDIVARRPRLLSEVLHRAPGGMVVPTPPHGYTLLLRGQCRPGIWLDGVEVHGANSIDQLLSPHDVETIEVFHGFELPVEFGVNPCGGILIWTRRGNPTASDPVAGGTLGLVAKVVALVALALVISR